MCLRLHGPLIYAYSMSSERWNVRLGDTHPPRRTCLLIPLRFPKDSLGNGLRNSSPITKALPAVVCKHPRIQFLL
uniref:Uncharacterized protein n=1 Tax=Steinernema glaseri TaxID=37863 RepID=A0A1I8AI99_9BILA